MKFINLILTLVEIMYDIKSQDVISKLLYCYNSLYILYIIIINNIYWENN